MKPVRLKIKGLNSFVEEQEIDFKRLTDKGLFGIFGPTGSGKSTILDAITLALYGEISRESKDFINTNCDSLLVSYEFEILKDGQRRVYIAERNMKKDKNGITKTKYARLIEKGEKESIIAEGPREVQKECIEIIGLTLDDFTRSVVLPQGKFSEFLKLKGTERRSMLERIFALEKYGRQMCEKIKKAKYAQIDKKNVLIGEFKKYEGLTEDLYSDKRKQLAYSIAEENELKKGKKLLDEAYEKYKNIWALQQELLSYKLSKDTLLKKQEDINKSKERLDRGVKSLKLKPYITDLENTDKKLKSNEVELKQYKLVLTSLEEDIKLLEDKFQSLNIRKEQELPILINKEARVSQAIQLEENLDEYKKERDALVEDYKTLGISLKEEEKNILQITETIQIRSKELEQIESRLKHIKIQPEYREKVEKALEKEKEYNQLELDKRDLQQKIDFKLKAVETLKKEYEKVKKSQEEKHKIISEFEKEYKELQNNFPGDNNLLLEKRDNLNKSMENLKECLNIEEKTRELMEKLIPLNEKKVFVENELIKGKELLQSNEKEYKELKIFIEALEKKNMSAILSSNLKEGEACPVCGATHHINLSHDNIEINIIDENKHKLKEKEEELSKIKDNLGKLDVSYASYKKEEEYINEELEKQKEKQKYNSEELKLKIKIEDGEFNSLRDKINIWSERTNKLKDLLDKERVGKNSIDTLEAKLEEGLKGSEEAIKENEKGRTLIEEKLLIISKEYFSLKEELNLPSIEGKMKEIKSFEREENKLREEQESIRKVIEEGRPELDKINEIINNFKSKQNSIIEVGKEKKKNIEALEEQIKDLAEGKNTKEYLEYIVKNIEEINYSWKNLKKELDEKGERKQKLLEQVLSREQNNIALGNLYEEQNKKLQELFKENKFENKVQCTVSFMNEEEIKNLEDCINDFEEQLKKLMDNIERIEKKLSGESVDQDTWKEIQENRENKENQLLLKVKEIASLQKTLEDMKMALKDFKELKKKELEIEHRLSLINDIDKLMQGNKFVEFVAMNRLKYIAYEASKRLKDITADRYALEIDSEGNFTIRDDKNGGVVRETSTLSGGETFLTSLALALSLSSQIQLKGSAPLEFFFLDEGFGTLDSDLLEVVMSSIEKLHSDTLSIGIISHVEELRNRVPIKLLVTPSNQGEGGSKVLIELN